MEIIDKYGRTLKTLRVSLTNACNLACVYCVSGTAKKGAVKLPTLEVAALAHYISQLHLLLKLDTVRLTGGEPTLYPHLLALVAKLGEANIPNLKMTTNGHLLAPLVKPLATLGLKHINISLDATTEEDFRKIANSKNLLPIFKSIDTALEAGIEVKLNAVILRGINDNQILPLLQFAAERGIVLRYLELMRMGPMFEGARFQQYYFPQNEILERIQAYYTLHALGRPKHGTANYWQANNVKFGIIANETEPFCSDCDRLRLDSHGRIFGCLSNNEPIDLTGSIDNAVLLQHRLLQALHQKQSVKFTGSDISMLAIGG